jgi:hypothetical protein
MTYFVVLEETRRLIAAPRYDEKNGNSKDKDNSRSPSGMTTRKATAKTKTTTAKTKTTT